MLEMVLAAALLTAPKESPAPDRETIEMLRPALLTLALDAELIDPREKNFLFTQDPVADLEMIRGRNEDLRNCPQMGECYRFPDRKTVNDFLAVNRLVRNNFHTRLTVDVFNEQLIREAITETDQLYQVWDLIRDANCEYYYVTVRRQALRTLRDLIGEEAFYSGNVPPLIPLWHLPRSR